PITSNWYRPRSFRAWRSVRGVTWVSCRVRQFHHVIEIARHVVAAELEDIYETVVRTGDRLEFLQPIELAFEMFGFLECLAQRDMLGTRHQRARFQNFAFRGLPP